MNKYMTKSFSQRSPKEYNIFRSFFQWFVASGYALFYAIKCGYRVIGRENIPKKGFYIIASNHISAVDPFLVCEASLKPVAYMAKEELFGSFWSRLYMDWMGAFAVKRGKLQVSTIKTAMGIKNTKWVLAMFPQGTREIDGNMDNVNRGFAVLAKSLKCDVVPMCITGALKKDRSFGGKMTMRIGKPIPYKEDPDEMIKVWCDEIAKLANEEATK